MMKNKVISPGKIIGYVRVSTCEQNPERQLEGLKLDRVFTDKASSKDTNRSELPALLNYVHEGNTIIIHSMDRLARLMMSKCEFLLFEDQIWLQIVKFA